MQEPGLLMRISYRLAEQEPLCDQTAVQRVFSTLAAGNGADNQEWLPTRGDSVG
jgi:hypothetical protein